MNLQNESVQWLCWKTQWWVESLSGFEGSKQRHQKRALPASKIWENCEQIEQSKSLYQYTFFYKNIVYTNIQAQTGQKIKNILRISSALVLAIVFCFVFFQRFSWLIEHFLFKELIELSTVFVPWKNFFLQAQNAFLTHATHCLLYFYKYSIFLHYLKKKFSIRQH